MTIKSALDTWTKPVWAWGQSPPPLFASPLYPINTVLAGGCFDIFHYGHLLFLHKARQQGDYLIVALESDEAIKRYKNRPPFHYLEQRAQMLTSLEMVDEVILLPFMQGYEDYLELVQTIKPQVIAVTAGDPLLDAKQIQAEAVGGKLVVVTEKQPPFSTSQILSGEVVDAIFP